MATRTKIAVVVRKDLAEWQKLNVTAFLISGITAANPDLLGADYLDADGVRYLPLLGQPVLVYAASAEEIARAHARAVERGMASAVYTEDMFGTGNDVDNRAAVAAKATAELNLVGFAVHDARNAVDKVCKGLILHP
ncbi:DUF2000 domain-containing protein [Saccharopolyspora sp. K220]|uniref:DUF2000 domain-containing protein n=1 Tax=Saccharopolyspora soli TaxID=2926618 RepID=UPI001F578BF2|nr:DUF2000 domain-containing protein [Saccharopolyspora soli]MCI2416498.1 DUF2000 domain-containing protein [Saccharopolyspora soli]